MDASLDNYKFILDQLSSDQFKFNEVQTVYSKLEAAYKEVAKIPPLPVYQSIEYTRFNVQFKIIDQRQNTPLSAITIFDQLNLNRDIPFALFTTATIEEVFLTEKKKSLFKQLYNNTEHYIKAWSGDVDLRQLLEHVPINIKLGDAQTSKINLILRSGSINDFELLEYDIQEQTIIVPVATSGGHLEIIETVRGHLQSILPDYLRVTPTEIVSYNFDFKLLSINHQSYLVEKFTFDNFVNQSTLFQSCLHFAEKSRPAGAQKNLRLISHLVNWSDEYQQLVLVDTATLILKPGFTLNASGQIERGRPLMEVSVSNMVAYIKLENTQNILETIQLNNPYQNDLIQTIGRCLHQYLLEGFAKMRYSLSLTLGAKFQTYLDKIWQDLQALQYKSQSVTIQHLSELRDAIPELKQANRYARNCPREQQPNTVAKELLSYDAHNRQYYYQNYRALPFPAENPRYFLVCNRNDEFPYVTVRPNIDMPKFNFEYFPCCIKEDPAERGNIYYDIYYGQDDRTASKYQLQPSTFVFIGKKVILEDRLYQAPRIFNHLLSNHVQGTWTDVAYIGQPVNSNMFLHGIVSALETPAYMEIMNNSRRGRTSSENVTTYTYIRQLRQSLSNHVWSAAGAQENPFAVDSEIKTELADNGTPLDPSRFLHLLEEIYNVNILLFEIDPKQRYNAYFRLPNYRYYSIRRFDENRLTLLFLDLTKRFNDFSLPVFVPLCVANSNNFTRRAYFYYKEIKQLFTIYTETLKLTRISFAADRDSVALTLNLTGAKQQIIDQSGKCRGLIYTDQTIIFNPQQPFNLPRADWSQIKSWPRCSSAQAAQRWTITSRGNDGLWSGEVYILTQDIPQNYPSGAINPLFSGGIGPANRLRQLQRKLTIWLQLLRWLFLLYKQDKWTPVTGIQLQASSEQLIQQFARDCLYLDTSSAGEERDSNEVYQLGALTSDLPATEDWSEALIWLSNVAPSLIKNGKFYIYNAKLARAVKYHLDRLAEQVCGFEYTLPKVISQWYQQPDDFRQYPNNNVFLSYTQFNEWSQSLINNLIRIYFVTKLSYELANYHHSYYYLTPQGTIYMIVNVVDGQLARAYHVAQIWQDKRVNLGFNASPIELVADKFEYYYLDTQQALSKKATEASVDSNTKLAILSYGNNLYAAILPLV